MNGTVVRLVGWVLLTSAVSTRADPPVRQPVQVVKKGSPIGQPLVHPDAWETDLQACLPEFKQRPKCLTDLLLRVPPRLISTFEGPAERLTAELTRWIGKDDLLNLYKVKERQLGEWMLVRHYVIEDSQGNVRLVRVTFRRVLGDWWLHAFRLYDRDEVDKELGLD